ncbi:MAG: response regulator transcription factor [Sedimentisphaerales bacterium]|nr:response regulator transcription factor [Sedimentisphaerales bacterium]
MATILVVEDELDVQKVIAKRLTSRGFTVHCAADGYQAVEMAHRVNPDLIVLDLQLPAGDGLIALRKMRMTAKIQRAHVIVLTGMTNEEYKQKVLKEGVDAYLQKPYDAQVLLDTIDKILSGKGDSENKDSPEELPLFDYAAKHQAGPST